MDAEIDHTERLLRSFVPLGSIVYIALSGMFRLAIVMPRISPFARDPLFNALDFVLLEASIIH